MQLSGEKKGKKIYILGIGQVTRMAAMLMCGKTLVLKNHCVDCLET